MTSLAKNKKKWRIWKMEQKFVAKCDQFGRCNGRDGE